MSKSYSAAQDQRVAVEGTIGTLVSPGAAVASPGSTAISAQPFSHVSQSITGLPGKEVQGLIDSVIANAAAERSAVTGLGEKLAQGIQSQSAQLGEIVAATKAPEHSALASLLPLALIGVVLYFLVK